MSEVHSSGNVIMRKNSTSHLRDGEQRRSRPDSCHKGKLKRLKTSSVGGFQRWEKENELLWAMLEDETEWLGKLFPDIVITPDLFFYALEDGVVLCRLANLIQEKAEEYGKENKVKVPGSKFKFHRTIQRKNKQLSLFKSRENVHGFLTWCRQLGISDSILFESNDIVEADECREGCREVVICLMEVARRVAAKYKLTPIPKLIQLENEIEAEEQAEAGNEEILYGSTDEESNDSGHGLTDGDNISPSHQHNGHNIHGGDGGCKKRKKSQPKSELDKEVLKIIDNFNVYNIRKIKEGKYLILGRIIFVRMLNGHVLLRIGGGWDTLEHYLLTHLPKDVCENSDSSSELTPSVSKTPQKSQLTKLLDKVKKATPSPNRPAASSQKHGESSEDDEKDITSAIRKIEFSVNQNIAVRRKHSKALLIEEGAEKTNAVLIDGNYSTDINHNNIELKRSSESERIKTSTPNRAKKMESEGNRSESGFFEETNNGQVFGEEEVTEIQNGAEKTTEEVLENGDIDVATSCVEENEATDHVDGNIFINNNETPLIENINVTGNIMTTAGCEQANTAIISDEKVIDKEQAINGGIPHSENEEQSPITTAGDENIDMIDGVTASSDDTSLPQDVSVKEDDVPPQIPQDESEGKESPKRVTSPTEKKTSETPKKKTNKDAKNDAKTTVKSTTAKKTGVPTTRPKTAPGARPTGAKPHSTRPTSAATNNTKRPTTAVKSTTSTTTKTTTTKTGKISPTTRVSPPKRTPTKPTTTVTSPKDEAKPAVRSPTKKPDGTTSKKTGLTAKKTNDTTKQPLMKKTTTTRPIDTVAKKKTADAAPTEKTAPKKPRPATAPVKKVGKVVQSKTESGLRPSSAKPKSTIAPKDPYGPVKTSSRDVNTANKTPGSKTTSKPGTTTTTTATTTSAASKKPSAKDTSRPQSPTKPLVRKTQTKTVTTLKSTKKNEKGEPEVQSQTIKTTRTVTETNGKKTTKTTMKEISPTGRKPFKLTTTQTIDTGKKKPTTTTTMKNEKPGVKKTDSKPSRNTTTTAPGKKPTTKTSSKANGKVSGQLKSTIPNNKSVKELSNALGLTKPGKEATIETADITNKSPKVKEVEEIKVDKQAKENSDEKLDKPAEITPELKEDEQIRADQIPDEKPVECIEEKPVSPEETVVVQETPEMVDDYQVEQDKQIGDHVLIEPVEQVKPDKTQDEQEMLGYKLVEPVVEKPDMQVTEERVEQVAEEPVEQVEEKLDEPVTEEPDEHVEEKPDEQVEEKPDEQVEKKPDEQVEEKPDEQVEEKPDEQVEEKPEEQVEEKPDEQVEEKPEEQVEEKPDEQVEEKPDEQVEEKPDEQVEEKPDEQVEAKPDEQVKEKPDEQVEEKSDEQVGEKSDEQVEEKLHEQVDDVPDKSEDSLDDNKFEMEEQVEQFSTEVDQHGVNLIGDVPGHVVSDNEPVSVVGSSGQPFSEKYEGIENEDPEHLQHFDDSLDDVIHVPPDQTQPEVAKTEPLLAWGEGDIEESERLGPDDGLFAERAQEQYPVSARAYQPFPAAFLESSADSDRATSMNENNNMSDIISSPQGDKLIDPDPFSPYRHTGQMVRTTDQTSNGNLLDFEQQGTREEGEGTLVTVDDLLS